MYNKAELRLIAIALDDSKTKLERNIRTFAKDKKILPDVLITYAASLKATDDLLKFTKNLIEQMEENRG